VFFVWLGQNHPLTDTAPQYPRPLQHQAVQTVRKLWTPSCGALKVALFEGASQRVLKRTYSDNGKRPAVWHCESGRCDRSRRAGVSRTSRAYV